MALDSVYQRENSGTSDWHLGKGQRKDMLLNEFCLHFEGIFGFYQILGDIDEFNEMELLLVLISLIKITIILNHFLREKTFKFHTVKTDIKCSFINNLEYIYIMNIFWHNLIFSHSSSPL